MERRQTSAHARVRVYGGVVAVLVMLYGGYLSWAALANSVANAVPYSRVELVTGLVLLLAGALVLSAILWWDVESGEARSP